MTKFAAYDDATIYAVADTAEMAIIEGRVNTNNPDAEFETAGISDALAAWIEENGWNGKYRSFDVRNGEIVDTTDE
jgi:glycerol dehydrogenase-like iron-containing ADH family enzyme